MVNFFEWYEEHNSCLISFLSVSELSPFNWAKEIDNLLSIWSGVSILSPTSLCFILYVADSSLSKSGISVVSDCSFSSSADSCLLNFDVSAVFSSNFGFLDWSLLPFFLKKKKKKKKKWSMCYKLF